MHAILSQQQIRISITTFAACCASWYQVQQQQYPLARAKILLLQRYALNRDNIIGDQSFGVRQASASVGHIFYWICCNNAGGGQARRHPAAYIYERQ